MNFIIAYQRLFKYIIFTLIYLLIVIPLIYVASSMSVHIFSIFTIGFVQSASIIDSKRKTYYNSALLALLTWSIAYFFDGITYLDILIIFFYAWTALYIQRRLKKRFRYVLVVNQIKYYYYLLSVLMANAFTSALMLWLLQPNYDRLLTWSAGTLIGSVVIVPVVIKSYYIRLTTIRAIQIKGAVEFIAYMIIISILTLILLDTFSLNKQITLFSLVLIIFSTIYFIIYLNHNVTPFLLFILSVGMYLFIFRYVDYANIYSSKIALIELHAAFAFLLIHLMAFYRNNFVKTSEVTQALVVHGYANMFTNLSAIKLIIESDSGNIVDANPAAVKYYGYTIDELKKMSLSDISIYDYNAVDRINLLLKMGNTHIESSHRLKNGKRRFVELFLSDFVFDEKLLKHIIVHDTTDKKRAEDELRISRKRFKSLLKTVSNYTYSTTYKNGSFLYTVHEESCFELTGYTASELDANVSLWKKLIHHDDLEMVSNQFKKMKNGTHPDTIEFRIINKNGKMFWIRNSPLVNHNRKDHLFIVEGVITDITKLKTLEHNNLKNVFVAQEKERQYFSQELHDGVAPLLSVSKLYADLLAMPKNPSTPCDKTSIANLQALLNEISQSVRNLSHKLNPTILENQGLLPALEQFANRINQTNVVQINLVCSKWKSTDDFVKKNIYRIVTELINNSLKYANAKIINVSLKNDHGIIEINYADDGVGFDVDKVMGDASGTGLANIKNRLSILNGDIKIDSKPNKGVEIKIRINRSNPLFYN